MNDMGPSLSLIPSAILYLLSSVYILQSIIITVVDDQAVSGFNASFAS
jgi:hypothetical protein